MLRIITEPRDLQGEIKRIRTQNKRQSVDVAYEAELRSKTAKVQKIILNIQESSEQETTPNVNPVRISGTELDTAYQKIPTGLLDALRTCCRQLKVFYQQRIPKNWVHFAENDVVLGKRYTPVQRAGFYVENLGALLTQAIPAQVAKVPQRVMVTPLDSKRSHYHAVLVAAQEVGIEEIYQIGGAAAIATLAYGSSHIKPVEVITGAGNWEVTLAKQLVNGTVQIDSPLKNTDWLIIADQTADYRQLAADLVAQAEQYPSSAMILITDDSTLAQQVQQQVQEQLQDSPSSILTEKALAHNGLIILVDCLEAAIKLIKVIEPYFLLLAIADPWDWLEQIHQVGAIFLGHHTPKATGDYLGGSSLVYPMSGSMGFGSTVSVETFLKPTNLIQYSSDALEKVSQTLQLLAQAEGLLTKEETIRRRIEGR
ncbi:MAG: histidinol dehydrogenase [Microcystaceae cyanobacterium]